jgi:endonuclease/exonuclease/phosphatase family metal-dependent hydrolase
MTIPVNASHFYFTDFFTSAGQEELKGIEASCFRTHTSDYAETLHQFSEILLLPARWNTQLFSCIVQPLPGGNKDHHLWAIAIRITAVALWILSLPIALISFAIGFPLRCLDHCFRPSIGFINNSTSDKAETKSKEELKLTEEAPLHIRTHNVGLVTSTLSRINDLRPPVDRATELAASIVGDPCPPDLIMFEEAFNEDATRVLCEGIKEKYPYIAHSIAPHVSGFSSGMMIASKYPIEKVEFQPLDHMIGPERLSPRGLVRVRIESKDGPVLIYGAHLQALMGEDRAIARAKQIEQIAEIMKKDHEQAPEAAQVLMGDFNTSRLTIWSEDNLNPQGQAEEETLTKLNDAFNDLYLNHHDPVTGKRTSTEPPKFLQVDNERMGVTLEEPFGTWFHGIWTDSSMLSWKRDLDFWWYNRPYPKVVEGLEKQEGQWGTEQWRKVQASCHAIFDKFLVPKNNDQLDGWVEIRRTVVPEGLQSASSDHFPVDVLLHRKKKT